MSLKLFIPNLPEQRRNIFKTSGCQRGGKTGED